MEFSDGLAVKGFGIVTSVAWVPSLIQGLPHGADVAKKEKKKYLLNSKYWSCRKACKGNSKVVEITARTFRWCTETNLVKTGGYPPLMLSGFLWSSREIHLHLHCF